MAKTKITPFARLLLFLLLLLPAAYFGASYYNGEDPLVNLKRVFGMEKTYSPAPPPPTAPASAPQTSPEKAPATFENVADLRTELKNLRAELAIAEERLARCQDANVE